MQNIDDVGVFWLPQSPEHTVGGRLDFDGTRLALTIDDALGGLPADSDTTNLLHGRLRSSSPHGGALDVTVAFYGRLDQVDWEFAGESRPDAALLGVHASTLDQIEVDFEPLVGWAEPPPLASHVHGEDQLRSSIDIECGALGRAELGTASCELRYGWRGEVGAQRLDAARTCAFLIQGSCALPDAFEQYIRPLQSLLVTLIGKPARVTRLKVRLAEHNAADEESVSVAMPLFAPDSTFGPTTWGGLRNWGSDALFARSELPLDVGQLITNWFDIWPRVRTTAVLAGVPYNSRLMYAEHRYSTLFLCAEDFAQAKYPRTKEDKARHRHRVARVIRHAREGGCARKDRAWAKETLSRNFDGPRVTVGKLVDECGPLAAMISARHPDFVRDAVTLRNGVAHPRGLDWVPGSTFYWYGEVLLFLVRVHLLVAAGIPAEAVYEQALKRGSFGQSVERLEPVPPRGS